MMERERYRGALAGLAIGDAVGTAVEFRGPGTFEPVTDMVGGGCFELRPGEWTDDTSMALCLATSFVERGGFDARDQMERYVRWRDEGYLSSNGRCFDIGDTVCGALSRFQETGDPFAGSTDAHKAGNGSLMRLAPVPLFYASDAVLAIRMSAESSRTTHGATACIDACRYFGALIVGALQGANKEQLLSPRFAPAGAPSVWDEAPLCAEIDDIAAGSFRRKEPPEVAGTGYVVKALEAALWAFHKTESYKDGCLLAVNLGNDADTTAAIFGQIAGAHFGLDGIPPRWRACVAHRQLIFDLADGLLRSAGTSEGPAEVAKHRAYARAASSSAKQTRSPYSRIPALASLPVRNTRSQRSRWRIVALAWCSLTKWMPTPERPLAVGLGPVACGVPKLKNTTPPAASWHGTASAGSISVRMWWSLSGSRMWG